MSSFKGGEQVLYEMLLNVVQDGDGVRVSIYVSGCHFHCKGCHNKEAWDFNFFWGLCESKFVAFLIVHIQIDTLF